MNNEEILTAALDTWKFKTRNINFNGFEKEDLEQELLIKVFLKVRENYDESKAQLSTYISRIIDNHIKDLFKACSRYKNVARYTSISFDSIYFEDDEDSNLTLKNGDIYLASKEDGYLTIELKNYLDSIYLTDSEKKVVKYLLEGYSKNDIAKILNVSKSRISCIIKNLKNKLKGEYDNYVTSI
jgi:RNA polymerase sporulation-specific sigma factor